MQTIDAPATDGLVTLSHVPVAILRWPEEVDRETALAETGALRLLLIPPSVTPPTDWDPAMDWIRLPADDEDIWRRVAGLQRRVRRLPAPRLDEYGVLWRDPSWVSLAPIEARIFALLLERPGVVCGRTRLMRSAWPDAPVSEHSLNAYIKRLRKRIEPLGLAINTVRRRGYFLEIDPLVAA